MGLFSKNKNLEVLAPVDGEIIDLSEVEDEVFADRMMGDGLAFIPESNDFFAPIEGKLVTVFPSGHAYGIKHKSGVEILLHIGLDTVTLSGEGFDIKVKQDQNIKAGDLLVNVDLDTVSKQVPSIKTPLVFTTLEGKTFKVVASGKVKQGDVVAIIE